MILQPISPFVQKTFESYEKLRPCFMSEGHFLNQFLWESYYHTMFATDDIALYLFFEYRGEKRHSALFVPSMICRKLFAAWKSSFTTNGTPH